MKSPLSFSNVEPSSEGSLGTAEGLPAAGPLVASPRTVIRGESFEADGDRYLREFEEWQALRSRPNPDAAITDYLNFSFPFSEGSDGIPEFLGKLAKYVGVPFGGLSDRRRGLHGYHESFTFANGRALFAFGGQANSAYVSMPGEGCGLIDNWDGVVAFLCALDARITRWDGAVDDYLGAHSVDEAVAWYRAGEFNKGGNRPSCGQAGNWIDPDGKGRTFYIGSRKSGKVMRIYEKGKQLGSAESAWVRWELELHNKDREIPYDVLLEPGRYVAGAYRCMGWVKEDASRIRTVRKTGRISYEHLCHYARIAYGPLLNVVVEVEGSPAAAIKRLQRGGIPSRLRLPGIDTGDLRSAEE